MARMLLPALALGATVPAGAVAPAAIGEEAVSQKIDSILQNGDKLDGMVRRAILNGGSKPVGFSGEAVGKFVGSSFFVAPQWMLADKTEFKNSSLTLRMAMVAKPHRNLTLWSKLAFNNALLGYNEQRRASTTYDSLRANDTAWSVAPSTGDANDKRPAVLYEDMAVGAIMSFGPAIFNFKAGGVLWNEMSPLTVWKTQPRMFGWDYLPFELEQSTAMFYDYATVKGFKEGRAAWNKKPFHGLQLESVELPWNLSLNTLYGYYEGYNKNYPWLAPTDKLNELQYTGEENEATEDLPARTAGSKGFGFSDSYRNVWFLRASKAEIPGGITAGINWFQYLVDEDYPLQWSPRYGYGLAGEDAKLAQIRAARPVKGGFYRRTPGDSVRFSADTTTLASPLTQYVNNYYIEPKVGSIDIKRSLPGGIRFHLDVGASYVDTVWFKVNGAQARQYTAEEAAARRIDSVTYLNEMHRYDPRFREAAASALPFQEIGRSNTGWKPAVYGMVGMPVAMPGDLGELDLELRTLYADPGFHSGSSTVGPINGIFPYESNMTGPGKFGGVDNGTQYSANLTGGELVVKYPVPRGHARMALGFHQQVKKGDDLIYMPWRQNGIAFNASLNSNFTRYGAGLMDDFLRSKRFATTSGGTMPSAFRMIRRLGDESFTRVRNRNPYAPVPGFAGGMRADYMSVYEGFAAYQLTSSWKGPASASVVPDSLKPAWIADSARWFSENKATYDAIVANQDSFYFRQQSSKATQNLSLDASYEISRLWEGQRSVFLSGYAAFNSITRGAGTGIPAFTTGKDVLLMGRNLRFEPVVQVTSRFYVIGLVTQEVWKSDYGVSLIDSATGLAPAVDGAWNISGRNDAGAIQAAVNNRGIANLTRAPIDYTDWMYGLGFDWDIAPRVGLHVRAQYFTHEDAGISVDVPTAKGRNDYRAWLGSTELKMWF
jgi:hypothetical protein